MELRKRALGMALGLVWGLAIMFGTWWLLLRDAPGEIFQNLVHFTGATHIAGAGL